MIELRLMRLNLSKVAIVKVSRILEFVVLEDYDSATLITYSQIISSLIERNGCQDV